MKFKIIFLVLFCNSIFSQKIDTLKYNAHKNRFNSILKNKKQNKDSLYLELAEMVHFNPKINFYEFLSKQQIQDCEKIANETPNLFIHSHLNLGLGNSTFIQIGPIQPLNYFLKCEKAFEKQNDYNCEVFCLLRISSIYSHNVESTLLNLKYIEKAIETAKKSKDSQLIGQSLGYKGAYFLDNEQYKTALLIFEKITKLKSSSRNQFINQFNIGKCYLKLGQKNKGFQIFENTLADLPKYDPNYIDYQIHIRSELIKHYIQNENLDQIKFHFKQMSYFANLPQINQYERRWFKNTEYLVQKALGKYKDALENLEMIKIKDDSLLLAQYNQQLEAKKGELSAKEKAILAENESLKAKQEVQNQYRWFFIFISIIGSLITFYILRTNKNLKEKNNQLLEKNSAIIHAHLSGQTTERQRVAIDLHDNLGSTISSIKFSLEAIDRSKMNEDEVAVQENLYSLLDKAYTEVRLLSHNLLPEEFEKKGLTETLTEFIRKINKASKIKFDLKIDENFGRQDHKIEFELYSICMELVNNIMKHSKATQARITLSKQTPPLGVGGLKAEQILLFVSDNGIGIFKNDSDGMGMKNIQARVDSINGKWTVKSVEGEGVVNEILV
jgi:signal transduction histidine kinase